MNFETFRQASRVLRQARSRKLSSRKPREELEAQATRALAAKDHDLAAWLIQQLLRVAPQAALWWSRLGLLHARSGRLDEAERAWAQALKHAGTNAELLVTLGRDGRDHGLALALPEALASIDRDCVVPPGDPLNPTCAASHSAWSKLLHGELDGALPTLEQRYWQRGRRTADAENLVFVLRKTGREAEALCFQAMDKADSGDAAAAAHTFGLATAEVRLSTRFAASYFESLRVLGREEILIAEAQACKHALDPDARRVWHAALIDMHGPIAASTALSVSTVDSASTPWCLASRLALQPVPRDAEALDVGLESFEIALNDINAAPIPEQPDAARSASRELGPAFLLGYQACSSSDLPQRYNRAVGRLLQATRGASELPSRRMSASKTERRIRIGYATSFANFHTVSRYFAGWIEEADRTQFELHLFPLATQMDWMSDYLRKRVDTFHPPARDWKSASQQILQTDLDVLIFPEIGMDQLTFQLACSRLARVQCAAWGHPISTGLEDVDYFLSAESMETDSSFQHYTEQLVLLPGLGVSIPAARITGPRKERADFGLANDDIVFVTPQSLFKYHPQDDGVFPRIAAAVPSAKIVFVEGPYPAWTRNFRERLQRVFAAEAPHLQRNMVFVPRQDFEGFLSLLAVSDVFLDCIRWSGGMTSLDALACSTPVVTLPGPSMRSRQSAAMLQQMGIAELTAVGLDDYIDIAVRLGTQPDLRRDVVARIESRRGRLFEQRRCVAALEAFLRWAAERPLEGDRELFKLGPMRG